MNDYLMPGELSPMDLEQIQVKRMKNFHLLGNPEGQMKKATKGSSGYDLLACIGQSIALWPNQSMLIPTGIAIFINNSNFEAQIRPRSGKGSKGLVLGNLIGTLDSDYQGEILICAWNRTEETITIFPDEPIAQLVFCPVFHPDILITEEFHTKTERAENGFGSTDRI